MENDIGGLIFKIIDLRSYFKAKRLYEEGQKEPDISKRPTNPTIDLVRDIAWELAKDKLAKSKESSDG